MATSAPGKTCEVDGTSCKRTIQARCYHCDKDLCRVHLLEHVQLVEGKTRDDLNSLVDQLNEVSSRFASLAISPRILEEPFSRLEQWRREEHERIDRTAEAKLQELNATIERYQRAFAMSKELQMKKIDSNKEQLAKMVEESDATREQIANLQSTIDQAMQYLASLDKHCINIIPALSNSSVEIRTEAGHGRLVFDGDLREFRITYVRLNGLIRSYQVFTNKDGNITGLKNNFVEEYAVVTEDGEMRQGTIDRLNDQPRRDFILAVEVYNHRIHLQYKDDHLLSSILDHDRIIFYETPHNLLQENNPRILMPCCFQDSTSEEPIGLPIYLDIPRRNCKGQDVRDAMSGTLGAFLFTDSKINHGVFDVTVQYQESYQMVSRKLHEVLLDEMNFAKANTSVKMTLSRQIVEDYRHTNPSLIQTLYNFVS